MRQREWKPFKTNFVLLICWSLMGSVLLFDVMKGTANQTLSSPK